MQETFDALKALYVNTQETLAIRQRLATLSAGKQSLAPLMLVEIAHHFGYCKYGADTGKLNTQLLKTAHVTAAAKELLEHSKGHSGGKLRIEHTYPKARMCEVVLHAVRTNDFELFELAYNAFTVVIMTANEDAEITTYDKRLKNDMPTSWQLGESVFARYEHCSFYNEIRTAA